MTNEVAEAIEPYESLHQRNVQLEQKVEYLTRQLTWYENSCRTRRPVMLMQWRRSCRGLKPCLNEHVTRNGNNLYGSETSPSLAGGDVSYSTS